MKIKYHLYGHSEPATVEVASSDSKRAGPSLEEFTNTISATLTNKQLRVTRVVDNNKIIDEKTKLNANSSLLLFTESSKRTIIYEPDERLFKVIDYENIRRLCPIGPDGNCTTHETNFDASERFCATAASDFSQFDEQILVQLEKKYPDIAGKARKAIAKVVAYFYEKPLNGHALASSIIKQL